MGRAIDMENDIQILKLKIEKLENTVRGMVSKLDSLDEKSSKTKHVDLVEDVKVEEDLGSVITGDYRDEEETNVEGSDEGDGELDKRSSAVKSKTNK